MLPRSRPHRPVLRQLLRAALPTDSDFSAFCGDLFPDVAGRFSNSMDRVAKANLLFELAGDQAVYDALREYDPQRLAALEALHTPADSKKNPYRGLSAFQLHDAHLFFGREALTAQLWQRFEALFEKQSATRLLAILGPSGSGKSSVARAGLLATLVQSPVPGPQPMRLVILKPGERPIENLARALCTHLPADSAVLPASRQIAIEKLLRDDDVSSQGLRRFAADLPDIATAPLVVLVDQFEELYTLCRNSKERELFVETLLHAASDASRHVSIILTLRSDFLGETQREHPALNRIIGAQHELLTAMSQEELRDVIARPAEHAKRPLDEATVQLLLSETRGSQGALPLLEFALTRIWDGMERGKEPGATLRKLGGVGGALAGEAQKIYEALSEAEQVTARRALLRLVRFGDGTRDTRRRVPILELCGKGQQEGAVLSVLRKFAAENARLVTLGSDGVDAQAEVTHEALFDHWAELRTWIEQGRKDRDLYDRALASAKLWINAERHDGRLWRPPDLDLLDDYQQRKPDDLNPLQEEFLAAGLKLQIQAREAVEKNRQQLLDFAIEHGQLLLFQSGKPIEALLWLHRAMGQDSRNPALPFLLKSAMQSVDATQAVLSGHTSSVDSAVFSPDGRYVVTASADCTAGIWEAESGRLLASLEGHVHRVWRAAFSPDGRYVVTASYDYTAMVWEIDGGRLLMTLMGHEARLNTATFSPDGRYIVTASDDGTARIWNTEDWSSHVVLEGHEHPIYSAVFSPDGSCVLTASTDSTARVWSAKDGRQLVLLAGHKSELRVATYSPDGLHILTASSDETARVWEAKSGRLVTVLTAHNTILGDAAFSPDGCRIVTSGDETARVWDADSGRLIAVLKGHDSVVMGTMFSPDSRRVVTASMDGTARIWDAKSGRLIAMLTGHGYRVSTATYSPDGRFIVTASLDGTARVWKAEVSRQIAVLKLPRESLLGGFQHAEFSPDGRRIVTACWGTQAHLWEASSGRLLATLQGHQGGVDSATFSPDGHRIVTASNDNTARLWAAEDGRPLEVLTGHEAEVKSAAFSLDGRRVVTTSKDKTARVWDVERGSLLAVLVGHQDTVHFASFSPDGKQIVTGSKDSTARVWQADSGNLIRVLQEHRDSVTCTDFSPDGKRILTASKDSTTRVWDAGNGQLLAALKGNRYTGDRATFSPDGRRIATAGFGKSLPVWEVDGGRLIAELTGYEGTINSASFSPDSRHIVTANSDHCAYVWEADGGRLIAALKGHESDVRSATYSPDGQRILTAGYDGARIWDASPETRTYEQIAELIQCHVPARFEREGSNIIVFRDPTEGANEESSSDEEE